MVTGDGYQQRVSNLIHMSSLSHHAPSEEAVQYSLIERQVLCRKNAHYLLVALDGANFKLVGVPSQSDLPGGQWGKEL